MLAFNHYAKIRNILLNEESGWYVKKINKPTKAKNFKGEVRHFNYYYRVFNKYNQPIAYCKFQQIELFSKIMNIDVNEIEIT